MSTVSHLPHRSNRMSDRKPNDVAVTYALDSMAQGDGPHSELSGHTRNDQMDMHRMGKDQELKRIFRPLSTFSFVILIQATWEVILGANFQGMLNGGLAGLFWSYIWTYAGFMFIVLSLAEMASMAPTSGGQYHWVSEFAPAQYQKILSYVAGWLSTLAWQAGVGSGAFLAGTITQSLIQVNRPTYDAPAWQGTLLVIGVSCILFIMNVWGTRALPILQNVWLVLHVFGFSAVMIFFWVLARVQPAKVVFTQFENFGGWSSMGLSLMVGQISSVFALIYSDAAAHMSEEVKNAGLIVPRAMVTSYLVNGSMGLIMLVTFLFCVPSVSEATTYPYPFLYVLQSSMSLGLVNGITILLLILGMVSNIDASASASRQAFALARDRGLPFSRWISTVHPKLRVPVNAVGLTSVITMLLSLINIGSVTALTAIISLQLSSLMMSYVLSIACVFYRRLKHPETLPKARWSLGRFGLFINGGGLLYSSFVFFWCFWPISTPTALKTFNWSSVMFTSIVIISGTTYLLVGRRKYVSPVALVRNERVGFQSGVE